MAKKWTNKNLPGALHFITGKLSEPREDLCGSAVLLAVPPITSRAESRAAL
jgi:hypothetical protein